MHGRSYLRTCKSYFPHPNINMCFRFICQGKKGCNTFDVPSMYSFIFMNVARLLTQTKRKKEMLSDLCDRSDSDLLFRRTLLGYYAEGMHAIF